jgi:hypothetical protein
MDSSAKFVLTMILVLFFCLLFFFLSGAIYVKKGHTVVALRKRKAPLYLQRGWHYALPFSCKLSSNYPTKPVAFTFSLAHHRKIKGFYEVKDPLVYFQGELPLANVLKDFGKETLDSATFIKESTQVMKTLGVELSSLEIIER